MSKGKKQKTAGADKANCSFRKAIENTPDVQHGYRVGLQAIVKADKRAVMVKDARRLDIWTEGSSTSSIRVISD